MPRPETTLSPADLEAALRARFGLPAFREGQREIVEAILRGEDALVVRPTGSGKSLCYQLPAFLVPGLTIVISPLISLMKDQCDALAARGLSAVSIHSGQDVQQAGEAMAALRSGRARLCYVAPERFRVPRFLEALAGLDVSILAVDEAHCVSEWGHEFRPDYRRLGAARETLKRPAVVALTATATARVRRDILDELQIPEANVFVSGFDRPNLHFEVERFQKREEKLARLRSLRLELGKSGAGLVYCSTRKSAAEVATSLGGERKGVGLYHAGLDPDARRRVQEAFMRDSLRVLVATNAFGMGIDRPDIRFVAHAEMPRSLEAYYQEAGRAGRDGRPARCLMLYGRADRIVHEFLIDESTPERELVERVWRALRPEKGPGPRDGLDIESLAEEVTQKGPRGGGKPRGLATEAALKLLEKAGHVSLGRDRETRTTTIEVRDAARREELRIDWTMVSARRGFEKERLQKVTRYAEGTGCRTRSILHYFGDRSPVAFHGKCEHCDGCGAAPPEISAIETDPAVIAAAAARAAGVIGSGLGDSGERPSAGALFAGRRESPRPEDRSGERAGAASLPSGPEPRGAAGGLPGHSAAEPRRTCAASDDPRTIARKVLSCVARMAGTAPRADVACCLTGSRSESATSTGHDRLSTYGLLRSLSQERVLEWIDALAGAGLLLPTGGARVSLTPEGIEVMAGRAALPPLADLAPAQPPPGLAPAQMLSGLASAPAPATSPISGDPPDEPRDPRERPHPSERAHA